MHQSAYEDAKAFVSRYLNRHAVTSIADVGSYDVNGTLKPLFDSELWSYTGIDISAGPNVDIAVSDRYGWSAGLENRYDVVVSTQTMEHVDRPWDWIKDVAAICKPGGLVYVCTPNTIGYHAYPIDCWRAWPDGMRSLLVHAGGLRVIECFASGIDTTGIARKD